MFTWNIHLECLLGMFGNTHKHQILTAFCRVFYFLILNKFRLLWLTSIKRLSSQTHSFGTCCSCCVVIFLSSWRVNVFSLFLKVSWSLWISDFTLVNTPATELLYTQVFDWCDTQQDDACVLGEYLYLLRILRTCFLTHLEFISYQWKPLFFIWSFVNNWKDK